MPRGKRRRPKKKTIFGQLEFVEPGAGVEPATGEACRKVPKLNGGSLSTTAAPGSSAEELLSAESWQSVGSGVVTGVSLPGKEVPLVSCRVSMDAPLLHTEGVKEKSPSQCLDRPLATVSRDHHSEMPDKGSLATPHLSQYTPVELSRDDPVAEQHLPVPLAFPSIQNIGVSSLLSSTPTIQHSDTAPSASTTSVSSCYAKEMKHVPSGQISKPSLVRQSCTHEMAGKEKAITVRKHLGTQCATLKSESSSLSDGQHRSTTAYLQTIINLPKEISSNTVAPWEISTSPVVSYGKERELEVDYYPKFFSSSDARAIQHQLEQELPPYLDSSRNEVKIMGRVHKIPRKQAAFGDPGLSYRFSGVTVAANQWITVLERIRDHLVRHLGEQFNFVLVNRYKDGLDHIGEHRDDERDLVEKSSIACVSLGQERDFVFKHKDHRRAGNGPIPVKKSSLQVLLKHGSLLVMKYPTNKDWYHCLPVRKSAGAPRISLTFRVMKR